MNTGLSKEKKKSVQGVLDKINKKFGANTLNIVSDIENSLIVDYYKTPSYEFNNMLSGGVAKGRILELYGNPGTGKTSLALETMSKALKEDPELIVAWLETEGSISKDTLDMFDIDKERMILLEQSEQMACEQCMDILRSLISSGEFGIITLNSVAGLLPQKEVSDEFSKANIALIARNLSKFLRLTTSTLAKNKTTLILINQVRQNLNSYIACNTTTGGLSIPFYSSQRVQLKKAKLEAGDPYKEEDAMKINCKVIKNRLAKDNPFKVCNYFVKYGEGIDGESEVPTVLIRTGVIRKTGAWLRYENEDGDIIDIETENGTVPGKWNGMAKFNEFLRENRKAFEMFVNIVENSKSLELEEEDIKEIKAEEEAIENSVKSIEE